MIRSTQHDVPPASARPATRLVKRALWASIAVIGLLIVGFGVTMGPILYRTTIGLKRYESTPPRLPENLNDKAVLIFSKTNGFRDDEQIAAANAALVRLAKENGWSSFVTENAAVFNLRQLSRFKVTVWNSVSGDVLTDAQRSVFRSWIEQGGGFVGLHGSGGDSRYAWKWYVDSLIGAQFIGHTLDPHLQSASIIVEDADNPAMRGLGPVWKRTDEWYSFASSPRSRGYRILARADEGSYLPQMRILPFLAAKDIRMGRDHPLVWTHCVGAGRAFYSALGHTASSYVETKHLRMIRGAIAWAGGLEGPRCTDNGALPNSSRSDPPASKSINRN